MRSTLVFLLTLVAYATALADVSQAQASHTLREKEEVGEPITLAVLAVVGVWLKAGSLILDGSHQLDMGQLEIDLARFVRSEQQPLMMGQDFVTKIAESLDVFARRLKMTEAQSALTTDAAVKLSTQLATSLSTEGDVTLEQIQAMLRTNAEEFSGELAKSQAADAANNVAGQVIAAASSVSGEVIGWANFALGMVQFGRAALTFKAKANDVEVTRQQIEEQKALLHAKQVQARSQFCAFIKSLQTSFGTRVAAMKETLDADKEQAHLADLLQKNIQTTMDCLCSAGVSKTPTWNKCGWTQDYNFEQLKFKALGLANSDCELGFWFGVYAQSSKALGPSGLSQIDCLKKWDGEHINWGFYNGCRDGWFAAIERKIFSSKKMLCPFEAHLCSVEENKQIYSRKSKAYLESDHYKNCCGTGSGPCGDDQKRTNYDFV